VRDSKPDPSTWETRENIVNKLKAERRGYLSKRPPKRRKSNTMEVTARKKKVALRKKMGRGGMK